MFLRAFVAALLLLSMSWANAIVFAINEGVSYRVPNEEIRNRYAAIAGDLSKLLKQPVTVEPIADYPTLRRGLADKQYDIAMVHPAHLSIVAIRDSHYKLIAIVFGSRFASRSVARTIQAVIESSSGTPRRSPFNSLSDLSGESFLTRKLARYC